MSRMIFLILMTVFTRVGVDVGVGANGTLTNFFVPSNSTTINFANSPNGVTTTPLGNQVLVLQTGPAGPAGPAGRDGRDGRDGVQGATGPAGAPGSGGMSSFVGLGGGVTLVGSCDNSIEIAMSEKFVKGQFFIDTVNIGKIDGSTGSAPGCAGRNVKVHFTTVAARDNFYGKDVELICTQRLSSTLKVGLDSNEAVFSSETSCTISGKVFNLDNLLIDDLGDKVGIEFI
jgi:hypothetical protein